MVDVDAVAVAVAGAAAMAGGGWIAPGAAGNNGRRRKSISWASNNGRRSASNSAVMYADRVSPGLSPCPQTISRLAAAVGLSLPHTVGHHMESINIWILSGQVSAFRIAWFMPWRTVTRVASRAALAAC